jgi:hypothetical protein
VVVLLVGSAMALLGWRGFAAAAEPSAATQGARGVLDRSAAVLVSSFDAWDVAETYRAKMLSRRLARTNADLIWLNPVGGRAQGSFSFVLVARAELPSSLELRVQSEAGWEERVFAVQRIAGPPHALIFRVPARARLRGRLTATVWRAGVRLEGISTEATVRSGVRQANFSGVWPITRQWRPGLELLFSVWVHRLFALPKKTAGGWRPLHQVTRNRKRNLLYNILGLAEDRYRKNGLPAVSLWGDCADVPYMLRAYFAWKLGLPMRLRECTRGGGRYGPRCTEVHTNLSTAHDAHRDRVRRFNAFARHGIAWKVHSGTTRTLPEDEQSDFYPIAVNTRTMLPGTVYVDVGGHVLVVTDVDGKHITAIDGHPDMSITIRRFSQRRFFPVYTRLRTGGFKRFRPIHFAHGRVRAVDNESLQASFSTVQYAFSRKKTYYRFIEQRLLADQG